MELQEDSYHKRHSFSNKFKLKLVKYYHDNLKNNNKTATHFHINQKQVRTFWAARFFYKQLHFSFQPRVANEKLEIEPQSC